MPSFTHGFRTVTFSATDTGLTRISRVGFEVKVTLLEIETYFLCSKFRWINLQLLMEHASSRSEGRILHLRLCDNNFSGFKYGESLKVKSY